ncbi:MAG: very short patch repair endonuclease [Acetobacteraceae bacterium]
MREIPRRFQPRRPTFDDVSAARRRNMSAIKGKHTVPEMVVRKLAHSLGYRYRVHVNGLPGRPDLVFPARRKVILVHGCFWHWHRCANSVLPRSRAEWWAAKLDANVARDARNHAALEAAGWRVLIVWECQTGSADLSKRLQAFLGPPGSPESPRIC